jgi:hypothetical protein
MDQSRGLERLPRGFVGQMVRSQSAQFFIYERQELRRRFRVGGLDDIQENRDV